MAETEGGNDCEGDPASQVQDPEPCPAKQPVSTTGSGMGKGAGSAASGGCGSVSRRSRRKQSDPRRLGCEVVHVKMEIDIKSEPSDDELDRDDLNDVTRGLNDSLHDFEDDDDDVFSDGKANVLAIASMPDSGLSETASHPKRPTSHARVLNHNKLDVKNRNTMVMSDDVERRDKVDRRADCQPEPEDLSIGKRKRERGDNRVLLAIPSVIRPPEQTQQRDRVQEGMNSSLPISQNSARRLRTLSSELQREGSLVELERDYRLKFRHGTYDEDYHETGSHVRHRDQARIVRPNYAISHEHKLALEPEDCNSSSPDLQYEQKHGHTSPSTSTSSSSSTSPSSKGEKKQHSQRSYKNLSRSRRIVANARERNRVHTISAAFEGLRRAVPSYSHNQKLSKLAILRIACSYILALAKLADLDYSPEDQQQMSFEDCVDLCTETLQAEGRSKRRKGPLE